MLRNRQIIISAVVSSAKVAPKAASRIVPCSKWCAIIAGKKKKRKDFK